MISLIKMYAAQLILCYLFLLSVPRHGSAERIRVDVTYSSGSYSRDEMKFYTKDTTICSQFNAKYKSRSSLFNTVTCECRSSTQSFFGLNGKKLSCKYESTSLYGCSSYYAQSLPKYKSTSIPKQIFYNSRCKHPAFFSIQFWGGNKFAPTTYSKDFKLVLTTSTNSEAELAWKDYFLIYTPYKGRLIKVFIECAYGSFPRTLCFVMKGSGTHTLYTDVQSSFSNPESFFQKFSQVIIGVAVSLSIVVILSIICCCYCCRTKRNNGNQAPGLQTFSPQQYVQPSYNHGYATGYPSSLPPEYTAGQPSGQGINLHSVARGLKTAGKVARAGEKFGSAIADLAEF